MFIEDYAFYWIPVYSPEEFMVNKYGHEVLDLDDDEYNDLWFKTFGSWDSKVTSAYCLDNDCYGWWKVRKSELQTNFWIKKIPESAPLPRGGPIDWHLIQNFCSNAKTNVAEVEIDFAELMWGGGSAPIFSIKG